MGWRARVCDAGAMLVGRVSLALIVTAFAALAVHASLVTPLFEPLGEDEALAVAQHWARGAEDRAPPPGDRPAVRPALEPPLVPWLTALGLSARQLHELEFLPRPRTGHDARTSDTAGNGAAFLHGADELFPWTDPVRGVHLLRLTGVLAGVLTLLATYALCRRLLPDRIAPALAATALVAFNPTFVHLAGSLSALPWAIALVTTALAGIAGTTAGDRLTPGAALRLGLISGAAVLTHYTALFLVPLLIVSLLFARRRAGGWDRAVDRVLAALLLTLGSWLTWNALRSGQLIPERWWSPGDGRVPHPVTWAQTLVSRYGWRAEAGAVATATWVAVLGGALLGLLAWRRGTLRRPAAWFVAAAAVVLNLGAWFVIAPGRDALGQVALLLTFPVLACALAAGWSAWVPRPVGALAVLLLGGVCWHAQQTLVATFHPPNRVHDRHFMAVNPVGDVPRERRHPTIAFTWPPPGALLLDAPELRWTPAVDPRARYTVRLSAPELGLELRSYEDRGLALSDRFDIPERFWDQLPSGGHLLCQVIRLPTLASVLSTPAEQRRVELSAVLVLHRERPEDRL